MKVEKDFYTTQELVDKPWFPIKSTITVKKFIESGELDAIDISTGDFKRYRIKKQSALDFVERRKFK